MCPRTSLVSKSLHDSSTDKPLLLLLPRTSYTPLFACRPLSSISFLKTYFYSTRQLSINQSLFSSFRPQPTVARRSLSSFDALWCRLLLFSLRHNLALLSSTYAMIPSSTSCYLALCAYLASCADIDEFDHFHSILRSTRLFCSRLHVFSPVARFARSCSLSSRNPLFFVSLCRLCYRGLFSRFFRSFLFCV